VKLRTRLFIAFFCLAVVPLAGLVFYSYRSSMSAFRQGVEAEATLLAAGMESRLEDTEARIRKRVEQLGTLPVFTFSAEGETTAVESGEMTRRFLDEIGEEASYLRGFQFVPTAPTAAGAPPQVDEALRAHIQAISRDLIRQAEEMEAQARRQAEEDPQGQRTARGLPTPEQLRQMKERAENLGRAFARAVPQEGAERAEGAEGEDVPAPPAPRGAPGEGAAAPEWAEEGARWNSEMAFEVKRGDKVLGRVMATLKARELIQSVLRRTPRDRGEIPFAVDRRGRFFVTAADQEAVREVVEVDEETGTVRPIPKDDWIVTTHEDDDSGITFGVARPVGEALQEMRSTAMRNLMMGLGLITVALVGMLPVSRRITRDVQVLSVGAHRIASGDLNTRVPVRSGDELGALSQSFNRMAEQLSRHQEELMAQERRRKEEEIERRVLAVENQRKTEELDEARRFQLSLLPDKVPQLPGLDLAVFTRTATEVGGDYYDFQHDGDHLTVAMGDAVGHGARAGTLVAVIKSLFTSFAHRETLLRFLADTSTAIRRMGLERSAMALALVRLKPTGQGWRASLVSAGMPPALLYRAATGEVEEILLEGMPLGGIADFPYREATRDLDPGDILLLLSDGFPEALNPQGHELGYPAVEEHFRAAARGSAEEVVQALTAATEAWTAGAPLDDDVTFVVIRRTEEDA
jgi:serine phosphatase RsbU (regulator of sigma subunit)